MTKDLLPRARTELSVQRNTFRKSEQNLQKAEETSMAFLFI